MILGYLSSGVHFLMGLLLMIQVREGQSAPQQKVKSKFLKGIIRQNLTSQPSRFWSLNVYPFTTYPTNPIPFVHDVLFIFGQGLCRLYHRTCHAVSTFITEDCATIDSFGWRCIPILYCNTIISHILDTAFDLEIVDLQMQQYWIFANITAQLCCHVYLLEITPQRSFE